MNIKRREFIGHSPSLCVGIGFISHLLSKDALASVPRFSWEAWVDALYDVGDQLIADRIDGKSWQAKMDSVYRSAPLAQLRQFIDAEKLLKNTEIGERGEKFIFTPINENGVDREQRRIVITKSAVVANGRKIPPHAHENMASAFLTLLGQFEVLQFDKFYTTEDHLWIKESRSEWQKPGQWSSISDAATNAHSLRAVNGDSLLFSTKIVEVKPGAKVRGRVYFDPNRAQRVGRGCVRVPIISSEEAFSL